MSTLAAPLVILIFAAASVATWFAGVQLSRTTDELDRRLNLGDAVGGIVLLGLAGSLPEVAITVSAAASHHLDIAAGNLIGGIATATMVLVICDLFASRPLTYLVGSLLPVIEGLLVVLLVAIVMMGSLLPTNAAVGRVSPASIVIVLAWLGGVLILNRARSHPGWQVVMMGSSPGRPHRRVRHPVADAEPAHHSMARVVTVFVIGCAVTLFAGVMLEVSGSELAGRAHIDGVVFGATVLSLATALPEISSGIEAMRLGDHQLAVADVFGGNAFQLCLFLLADLVGGSPALPSTGAANAWLAALAVVLTTVYLTGVIVRPSRPRRIGPDSLIAILVYVIGVFGLLRIAQ